MGENTAISWTDHTFNPWWGCVKISPACTNCYAAAFDHRLNGDHWGPKSDRKFFGDKHWSEPLKWNRAAEKTGIRSRVFCASMADVAEDRPDLVEPRARLFKLIQQTPWLDWLLLTKRPENLPKMLPWCMDGTHHAWKNVWIGTTVENQEYAELRIPLLLAAPATVHFLSMEPLLGPVDLAAASPNARSYAEDLDWVIVGCESGKGARRSEPQWYRSLRDQCETARVPFFLKQAVAMLTLNRRDEPITFGAGSKGKGTVVELPYLDGVQHAAFPVVP